MALYMTFIKSISTFISLMTLFFSFSLHANFEEQDKRKFEDTRKEALNHMHNYGLVKKQKSWQCVLLPTSV